MNALDVSHNSTKGRPLAFQPWARGTPKVTVTAVYARNVSMECRNTIKLGPLFFETAVSLIGRDLLCLLVRAPTRADHPKGHIILFIVWVSRQKTHNPAARQQ